MFSIIIENILTQLSSIKKEIRQKENVIYSENIILYVNTVPTHLNLAYKTWKIFVIYLEKKN